MATTSTPPFSESKYPLRLSLYVYPLPAPCAATSSCRPILSPSSLPPSSLSQHRLTPDALNRFRLTHPDSTRAVTKRLNRLPYVLSASAPDAEADTASEVEIALLEVQRWRFGVERTLASVRSLDRQGEEYRRKAGETGAYNFTP